MELQLLLHRLAQSAGTLAEVVVDQFIDHAAMNKLNFVTIIHGKGTGALRTAVHDILRRNKKLVKDFRLGAYGEGESGVTVVTLK